MFEEDAIMDRVKVEMAVSRMLWLRKAEGNDIPTFQELIFLAYGEHDCPARLAAMARQVIVNGWPERKYIPGCYNQTY